MNKKFLTAVFLIAVGFTACKKETEELQTPAISDYAPLAVGKYIVYNLDSLLFINFGNKDTVISYQVKDQVDAEITDNLGRPGFRIIRYIRKSSTDSWVPNNTFEAVNTGTSLEFTENNLRYLKLKQPVRNTFSWKGNSFIDTYSATSDYTYMDDWDYTYDSVGVALNLDGVAIENTLKVDQRNESIGNPDDPSLYSQTNIASENYAKGIGLVYRKFLHREHQPPTSSTGYDIGYGITLTMIDHN